MSNFDHIFDNQGKPPVQQNKEFDKEAWAKKKDESRKLAYSTAQEMAEQIQSDPALYREYLTVQARNLDYSPTNAMIITAMCKDATELKTRQGWRDEGAYIKKAEWQKGIPVLVPGNEYEREDGSIGTGYDVRWEYDKSQTTARKTIEPSIPMEKILSALISKPPFPIQAVDEIANDRGALFDEANDTIFIKRGMEAPDIFRCLSVELAKAELSLMDIPDNSGFKAYCASYILCEKYGIDTKSFAFDELPESITQGDHWAVREELGQIREAAANISERMENVLERERPAVQRGTRDAR